MKIPQCFVDKNATIVFGKKSVEYQGNYPGIRITNDGWSIQVANQKQWKNPITMVMKGQKTPANLYIHLKTGISASFSIYYLVNPDWANVGLFVKLDAGAKLTLNNVFIGKYNSNFMVNRVITQADTSEVDLSSGIVVSGNTKIVDHYELNGEKSRLSAVLLAISGQKEIFSSIQEVFHNRPVSQSNVTNLLVSAGKSQMHVDVTETIGKGNFQSICHQNNRGIILEEKGSITVEPKLIIDEYDVDAGHGCAIGQINANELYYLLSRGIDETTAKRLIISGYLTPLYKRIDNPGFLKILSRTIELQMKGNDC
ncbi:MAG: SufD family Fe-S cluster assembly protein [Candidatus Izemoplasmatales bacterium]|jgi:Fe-S cluster assembly protein SufD|nr:SufD family Fe-S cluster assembly protein [Candidatus Izemoplasmatales bacterium]MDD3865255.1 SufD family Fe-S cluster assembly protein [Candidatus Izemoplasmatales bacterium]